MPNLTDSGEAQPLRSPTEQPSAGSRWAALADRYADWASRKKGHFLVGLGALFIIILFLWPNIVVSIYPGEAGVYYSRFFGGTRLNRIYTEGIHILLPWNRMYIYDTRIHEETNEISVLTKGGLGVGIVVSVRYYPVRDRLPELHQRIGPDYREKLIMPLLYSSVRDTLDGFSTDELYDNSPEKLQDTILVKMVEGMGRKPIVIDGISVRRLNLPAAVSQSISQKYVKEQEYHRYHYELLIAREEMKRRFIEAESLRLYQDTVNRGLTDNFLRWAGIEATKKLAESPNTKIVIAGGKDGLPLILNPDAPGGNPSPAQAQNGKSQPLADAKLPRAPNATAFDPGSLLRATPPIEWDVLKQRFTSMDAILDLLNTPIGGRETMVPAPAKENKP